MDNIEPYREVMRHKSFMCYFCDRMFAAKDGVLTKIFISYKKFKKQMVCHDCRKGKKNFYE